MKKSSATFTMFRNSSYSIFAYLWSFVFAIILTPIIIFELGIKEYGIYLFITTVISLLTIIDLGISPAVTKRMSFYVGKNDEESIKRLMKVGNLIFFTIGLFSVIVASFVSLIGVAFLPTSFLPYERYLDLFIFSGLSFFFTIIISGYSSVFYTLQRFDISTKISIFFTTFSGLGMLFAVWMGWGLKGIFISQLILAILNAIITYYLAKKLLPIVAFRIGWNKQEFFECFKFGLVSSLSTLANTALTSLDRLVIPFYVGPSNLTYYSMPGNVTTRIPGIAGALCSSMLPLVSQLNGGDDFARIKILYVKTFRLVTIIAGALTITTISFSYQILQYWLSVDFAENSTNVLIILALTNFILALFGPLSSFLLGLNKLKFVTISSIGMAILNAIALFIFIPSYGITGAAFAYLISVLPVFYLFYYVETRYLQLLNRKNHYIRTILGTAITALIVGVLNFFLISFIVSIFSLLMAGMFSVLAYVIIYKLLGFFEEEDWKDIERFSRLILEKLKFN